MEDHYGPYEAYKAYQAAEEDLEALLDKFPTDSIEVEPGEVEDVRDRFQQNPRPPPPGKDSPIPEDEDLRLMAKFRAWDAAHVYPVSGDWHFTGYRTDLRKWWDIAVVPSSSFNDIPRDW